MMLILMLLKLSLTVFFIEEDEVKKNPEISDADTDFGIVGQDPPLYYSNKVKVISRLKPFNIDLKFDDAETIKYTSDNDDN